MRLKKSIEDINSKNVQAFYEQRAQNYAGGGGQ